MFIQQKIAVHKSVSRNFLAYLFNIWVLLKGWSRILKDHNPWPGIVVTFFRIVLTKVVVANILLFAYVSSVDTFVNDNKPFYIQFAWSVIHNYQETCFQFYNCKTKWLFRQVNKITVWKDNLCEVSCQVCRLHQYHAAFSRPLGLSDALVYFNEI